MLADERHSSSQTKHASKETRGVIASRWILFCFSKPLCNLIGTRVGDVRQSLHSPSLSASWLLHVIVPCKPLVLLNVLPSLATQFSNSTSTINSLLVSLFSPTYLVTVHTQESQCLWALHMGGPCSNNLVLVKIDNGSTPRSHIHRSKRRHKQKGLLSRGVSRRGVPQRNSQQHPTCLGTVSYTHLTLPTKRIV